MKMRKCFFVNLLTGLFFIFAFTQQGCLYDKPQPLANCSIPANVTYSGDIKPILTTNCTRCHVGPNAVNGAGIRLDEHPYVIMQVPQPLLDAINHTGSVIPMPRDGGKLDACSIAKIKKWIDNGAPNN